MPVPYIAEPVTFTQPDGRTVKVLLSGNQFRASFKLVDGTPLALNPQSGYLEVAHFEDNELAPSGLRADSRAASAISSNIPADEAGYFAVPSTLLQASNPPRWQLRRAERLLSRLRGIEDAPSGAPPQNPTVGKYVGLCLLIDFPDVPSTISATEVSRYCNDIGYTGFGNNGSVYDYFIDQSRGKLQYKNIVTQYYTARHPRSYYTDESITYPNRALELIREAIYSLIGSGWDFSNLSADSQGYVHAMNIFYAGHRTNNWSQGLWPHSWHLAKRIKVAPGKYLYDYQITDIGDELTLGTFCHENGHMICDFPDLYDYDYDSYGVGQFCLMCNGGSITNKNPNQICAYLKYSAGWVDKLKVINNYHTIELSADGNDLAIFRKNQWEYFLLENRRKVGRDKSLPDEGLALWHIDELGNNSYQDMSSTLHYECSLIQADGRYDMEGHVNFGDDRDLFGAPDVTEVSDNTTPNCKWWDGSNSGLSISKISAPASSVTFSVSINGGNII